MAPDLDQNCVEIYLQDLCTNLSTLKPVVDEGKCAFLEVPYQASEGADIQYIGLYLRRWKFDDCRPRPKEGDKSPNRPPWADHG